MAKTFKYYQDKILAQDSIFNNIVLKASSATISDLYRLCTGISMLQLTNIDYYRPDVSEAVMSRISDLLLTQYTIDESALLDKCFDIITTEPLIFTSTDNYSNNLIGRRRFEDFGLDELENITL